MAEQSAGRRLDREEVLAGLDVAAFFAAHVEDFKLSGKTEVRGRCPFHEDQHPSLDVNLTKRGAWTCRACGVGGSPIDFVMRLKSLDFLPALQYVAEFSGHGTKRRNGKSNTSSKNTGSVREAAEQSPKPATPEVGAAFVAIYPYLDADGREVYRVCRTPSKEFPIARADAASPTGWYWGRGDVPTILYNLPAVLEAKESGRRIYVTEGERDADAINNHDSDRTDYIATTAPGGAAQPGQKSKWLPSYADALAGAAHITVWGDNDAPGHAHANEIYRSLFGRVGQLEIVRSLHGAKDAADHLTAGHELADVVEVQESAKGTTSSGTPSDPADLSAELFERHARFVETYEETPRPWDLASIIRPGKVTAAWGPANQYKTTLLFHLACSGTSVAEGTRWLGHRRLVLRRQWTRGVLWMTAEEDGPELRALRAEFAAGQGAPFTDQRVRVLDVREMDVIVDMRLAHVDFLLGLFKPDLIVFDNWGVLQPAREQGEPEFSPQRDRTYLRGLHKLLEKHDSAALILMHPNKAGDAAGTYQLVMAGVDVRLSTKVLSRDIEEGTARICVEVEKVRGGPHVGKFVVKAAHGLGTLSLALEAEGDGQRPEDLKGKARAVWLVLCGAAPGWLNTSEVAAKADCRRQTARIQLDGLAASNWVEKRDGERNADEWRAVEQWMEP